MVRADIKFQGFKFCPAPEVNGVMIDWMQNVDTFGGIPRVIFRMAANKMHKSVFTALSDSLYLE